MPNWKTFDKTVVAWLIRDAFNILFSFDKKTELDSEGLYWVDEEGTTKIIKYF